MAEPVDAAAVAQQTVRLGLVDEPTAKELLYELDSPKAPANDLLQLMERRRLLTPFQTSKLRKGDTDGYFLGGFRILYKIASGSFGRVYRGDDPRTGQVVAVKVLRKRHTEDQKRVEAFEREGRIGMSIEHPNIVRILNVGKDGSTGQHYLVMEFVEGGTLRDLLAIRKKIEPDEALRIMEECAAGLAYGFGRGLSHRDIKPTNILIGTDRIAKLVDFGLAGVSEGGGDVLLVGVKKAEDEMNERTVDYAGLEKATGVPHGDVRSDIYFLGHVLYEMLAGEPLMPPTKNAQARMSRRRFEDAELHFPRLAATHNLPPSVVRLIAKAIALEPSQRFQSPTQFHEAVKTARLELAGGAEGESATVGRRAGGPPTLFVVEGNAKLQDVFREKFKKYGFRVLISLDAGQALKRYQTQPYHALVIDARTAGQDGIDAFRRVVSEAHALHLDIAAALILGDDQKHWEGTLKSVHGHVFVGSPTMKQLLAALAEHLPELRKTQEVPGHDHDGEHYEHAAE